MSIKDKLKILVFGYKATSESYTAHLRKIGVNIGEDVFLYRPYNTTIDVQNPHLLTIGSHVMITGPVTILTHDYSWSVIKRKYGCIVGNQKKVSIGDNVFIGWGATILAGTEIGDNTIIGANSVVSGKLEADSVYAGNPARKIMDLDSFYEKRLEKQKEEAFQVVNEYYKRYHKTPEKGLLNEYFYLFTGDDSELCQEYISKLKLLGNYDECVENLKQNTSMFTSYEDFMQYCMGRIEQ